MTEQREDNTIILRGFAYYAEVFEPKVNKFSGKAEYSLRLAIADKDELAKANKAGLFFSPIKHKKDENEPDNIAKDEEGNPIVHIPYKNLNLRRPKINGKGKEAGPIEVVNSDKEKITTPFKIGNGTEVAVKMLIKRPATQGVSKGKSGGYPLKMMIINLVEYDGSTDTVDRDEFDDFDDIKGGYTGTGEEQQTAKPWEETEDDNGDDDLLEGDSKVTAKASDSELVDDDIEDIFGD